MNRRRLLGLAATAAAIPLLGPLLSLGADTAAMHMAWMQGVPAAVITGHKPARTIEPLPPARAFFCCGPWQAR